MKSVLSRYILTVFASQFSVIFVILTGVFSVATLIRLADLTSIAEVNALDMANLFALMCPQIAFYCLPLSLFAATTMALSQLSNDRETTAFIALGAKTHMIAKPIAIVLFIASLLLLVIGLWLVPAANVESRNMIETKKAQITVSIHPGEGAQRFGEWLAFAHGGHSGELTDITLFSAKKETRLIFADKALINTSENGIKLTLDNGVAYQIDEQKLLIGRLNFEQLILVKKPPSGGFETSNIIEYWSDSDPKRKKDFANTVLAAFFPIASIFYILSIGLFHPRFRKNHSAVFIIIVATAYYLALLAISPVLLLWAIPVTLGGWMAAGYFIMKRSIRF
jgi:lipopolysaccharide export system permease protein